MLVPMTGCLYPLPVPYACALRHRIPEVPYGTVRVLCWDNSLTVSLHSRVLVVVKKGKECSLGGTANCRQPKPPNNRPPELRFCLELPDKQDLTVPETP